MAQYVEDFHRLPTLIDFVDVDSAKWTQYAPRHRWPLSWLYRREGRLLLDYERRMAARSTRSFFVTENEAALFCQQAPECRVRVEAMCNGVDADYFSPDPSRPSPYKADELPVVFTGAMDYLPNVDAVAWFKQEVLPDVLKRWPKARFYIVGRSPTAAVLALAGDQVVVTGTVPDVRPYLQHAAVVVAPLRIARGIQNKILEAMAMARPVIASAECAAAVDAEKGTELLTAGSPAEYIAELARVLDAPEAAVSIGQAARRRVVEQLQLGRPSGSHRQIPSFSQRRWRNDPNPPVPTPATTGARPCSCCWQRLAGCSSGTGIRRAPWSRSGPVPTPMPMPSSCRRSASG